MIPRARAFQHAVIAWSRSLTPRRPSSWASKRNAWSHRGTGRHRSSVHVSKPDTRNLIGPGFAAMRDGAYFINTSRGETTIQQALVDAIHAKGLRAGLDNVRDRTNLSRR